MTMLGVGSFPAADVTAFQAFHDQSINGHGGHSQRSVSPWTQQSAECCQNYQLPSSRVPSDQFTPQEYSAVTKLPPRQLQWVTSSHTHGYDMAALTYDVELVQSEGHHLSQLQQVAVTTSNSGWTQQFNQAVAQNLASVATNCSGSSHLIQTFQDPTKNYVADCPPEQVDAMMQSVRRCGQFTDVSSSAMTAYTADQPRVSDCTSYCVPAMNLYSGSGVKSDPDDPTDWQCTLPPAWHQQTVCLKSSPGQQTAGTSITSPLHYPNTLPYTQVQSATTPWSATGEERPIKVTPSTSIGERTNSMLI